MGAEKKAIEEEKKRIFFSMVGEMEAKSKEAEELEYLRNELYHEEHEAELREKERLAEEKRNQDRAEMLRAYEQQMAAKEEKMRVEREEEEKLRAQLLAKFAEDDRIEQMNMAKPHEGPGAQARGREVGRSSAVDVRRGTRARDGRVQEGLGS